MNVEAAARKRAGKGAEHTMLTVGGQEMVIIFIVALVLFGPKKLPELGRTVGKVLTQFRHVTSDLKASFEREMQNLERETEAAKLKELGATTFQTIHEKANEFAYFRITIRVRNPTITPLL